MAWIRAMDSYSGNHRACALAYGSWNIHFDLLSQVYSHLFPALWTLLFHERLLGLLSLIDNRLKFSLRLVSGLEPRTLGHQSPLKIISSWLGDHQRFIVFLCKSALVHECSIVSNLHRFHYYQDVLSQTTLELNTLPSLVRIVLINSKELAKLFKFSNVFWQTHASLLEFHELKLFSISNRSREILLTKRIIECLPSNDSLETLKQFLHAGPPKLHVHLQHVGSKCQLLVLGTSQHRKNLLYSFNLLFGLIWVEGSPKTRWTGFLELCEF